tara:strand:- start:366 stop:638 length:273 start_codon:yes stop_codon:yes gene_type:complete
MKLEDYPFHDYDEYTCMYNSYLVLAGHLSHTELLERGENLAFIFNPTKEYIPLEDDVYEVLIDYFKNMEYYEICTELQEAKKLAKLLINF